MESNSIKKNFLYNSVYQILAIIIPFVTTPYLARTIGAQGLGKYTVAFSIADYFVLFSMMGLNNYGNRSIASVRDDKEKMSQAFWSIYTLQAITSTFCITIYLLLCLITKNMYSYLMIFYVLSGSLDINWFFFGIEKFKITVLRNTIIKILSTLLIFVFVKTQSDVWKYVLIMSLSFLVCQMLLWPFVVKEVNFLKPSFIDIKSHIIPNLLLFVPVIAVSLYKKMDKIMLGFLSSDLQVGYYESAERVLNLPISLVNALGVVMLPQITNLLVNGRKEIASSYIEKSILFVMFLSSSISFGIMSVAREFVPLYYGSGFDDCILLFFILLPSCLFVAFSNVIRTQYIIPNHEDYIYIKAVSAGAIVNTVTNYILIKPFGASGAAISTLISEMIVCVVQLLMVKEKLPVSSYAKNCAPFVMSGFIMFFVMNRLSLSNNIFLCLALKIGMGIILYFAVLIIILAIMYTMNGQKDSLIVNNPLIDILKLIINKPVDKRRKSTDTKTFYGRKK